VRRPDALYLIEDFPDRAAALEFLRGCEVRDERVYVIAENPQGNLGKDLVMIFEEADGAFVELAERSPAPVNVSFGDCARCGYAVIPASAPGSAAIHYGDGQVRWSVSLDQMEMTGQGFKCTSCGALICAACCRAVPQQAAPDGRLELGCWICDRPVDVFQG
jgi:hypothetical protein